MSNIFVCIKELKDNQYCMDILQKTFNHVIFPTSRDKALQEMLQQARECEAAVVGLHERLSREIIENLRSIKIIGTISSGTDNIDVAALQSQNIRLFTAGTINAKSVAEHALAMMLYHLKQLPEGNEACRTGADRSGLHSLPLQLAERRVGIIGAGQTARELINRLLIFGARISIWTWHPERHQDLASSCTFEPTLEDLMLSSSIVSIHMPLTDETREIVTGPLLLKMQDDAVLVNVARKELVEMTALPDVLMNRKDIRVAIDATGLQGVGGLFQFGDRVLATPHVAGVTQEALRAMQNYVVRSLADEVIKQRRRA